MDGWPNAKGGSSICICSDGDGSPKEAKEAVRFASVSLLMLELNTTTDRVDNGHGCKGGFTGTISDNK